MSKVSCPRRSGKAGLIVRIQTPAQPYPSLYEARQVRRDGFSRCLRLAKLGPQSAVYEVGKSSGSGRLVCSCPDFWKHGGEGNKFKCKHILACVATGLISARLRRPSEEWSAARQRLRRLGGGLSPAAALAVAHLAGEGGGV